MDFFEEILNEIMDSYDRESNKKLLNDVLNNSMNLGEFTIMPNSIFIQIISQLKRKDYDDESLRGRDNTTKSTKK